jgi:hypothetical protein
VSKYLPVAWQQILNSRVEIQRHAPQVLASRYTRALILRLFREHPKMLANGCPANFASPI